MRKMMTPFAVLALVTAALVVGGTSPASTSSTTEECVPAQAWTETIEHPAVTHEETIHHPAVTEVIHHEAVTRVEPGVWANWSPNSTQGPQDYEPIWPTDDRGTWHVHSQGVPPGHAGPDGVYQQGGGNSPWFYRQAEHVIVVTPAYDETVVITPAHDEVVTVVDKEAWTETIEHDAVTCEDPPGEPCPDDMLILNPETGECEPNPCPNGNCGPPIDPGPADATGSVDGSSEPTGQPGDKAAVATTGEVRVKCLGGARVTERFLNGDRVSVSTESGHRACAQAALGGEPVKEEGL